VEATAAVKYRTIVADPPWHYGDKFASFTHGGNGPEKANGLPYASMTLAEISALPVANLAADDSRLFLWTTNRYLPASFTVLEAWGFRYVQNLVWHKTGNPSPLGGSIAPQHHEHLLVAVRGKPDRSGRLASSVVDAPAPIFGHSTKPEAFLDFIEIVSPGPYVELFARRARFGWHYWGDESLGTAELQSVS
jgi:N6-adenosine-specific RNA methylase IME4